MSMNRRVIAANTPHYHYKTVMQIKNSHYSSAVPARGIRARLGRRPKEAIQNNMDTWAPGFPVYSVMVTLTPSEFNV
jgi:hypothetical protein